MRARSLFALSAVSWLALFGCSSSSGAGADTGNPDTGSAGPGQDAQVGPSNDGSAPSDSGTPIGQDGALPSDTGVKPPADAGDGGPPPDAGPSPDAGPPCTGTDGGACPLMDMHDTSYKGFGGGLYANGSNDMPAAHAAVGVQRAMAIQPLDINGNPSATGKIVMLGIGMSNTSAEWCARPYWTTQMPNCAAGSFMQLAAADNEVNHATLAIVNGCADGQTANAWDLPNPNFSRITSTVLMPQGLSDAQVQIIWTKLANPSPHVSLPDPMADAYNLEQLLGMDVRFVIRRYPNLKMMFLSSRIYGGYATSPLNPEPYAYESGFAVKWLVQAQIDQMAGGGTVVDQHAGDLNYMTGMAPWIAWGPYLWADGTNPRSDGLTWVIGDFDRGDGTHPAPSGVLKVGTMLLNYFKTSRVTKCWFLANGGTCQ